jgi:hypothetical protein
MAQFHPDNFCDPASTKYRDKYAEIALSLLSSAAQASIESANSVPARPSAAAKCHRYAYLRASSSMKRNFGCRALCLIMALHVLPSRSRRNCASMCGAKG